MIIRETFEAAKNKASAITNWKDRTFSWDKGYVCCAMAALAYEEVPEFELKNSERAKVIPCDSYQAHVSRWNENGSISTISGLDLGSDSNLETVIRERVIVSITGFPNVIFVAFRGTTVSFADIKTDLDIRKAKISVGAGDSVKLHRGFFNAVLDCYDETVEKVAELNKNKVPVYVTGHSLGGAMASIFHSRISLERGYPFRRQPPNFCTTACYSFGMPRTGDTQAKLLLAQPYHIYNEFDAIPTLPPTFLGYVDSPNERTLNAIPKQTNIRKKGNFGFRLKTGLLRISDHRMERYTERLKKMC